MGKHSDEIFHYFEAVETGIEYPADTLSRIEDDILQELREEVDNGWLSEVEASALMFSWMQRYHKDIV
jgi:hypothetical protein